MSETNFPSSANGKSSDFIGSLDQAIRANPIPAALVGLGALWLFAGGRSATLAGATQTAVSGVAGGVKDIGSAAYGGARAAGGHVIDGMQAVGRTTAGFSDKFTRTAESTAKSVGRAVDHGREIVGEVASQTTTSSGEGGERAQSPANAGANGSGFQSVRGLLEDMFARQPLMLGAFGLAVGAAIAASIPSSNAENSLMGETADIVKSKAGDLLQETKQRASDVASKGLQEAERQGLTPSAASAAAGSIARSAANLADKVAGDIVDRTKR